MTWPKDTVTTDLNKLIVPLARLIKRCTLAKTLQQTLKEFIKIASLAALVLAAKMIG